MKCRVVDVSSYKVVNRFISKTCYEYTASLESPYGLIIKQGYSIGKLDIPIKGSVIDHVHLDPIKRLSSRLLKLNITLEFSGNLPWIYLDSVNGVRVKEKFRSDHHFTAFMMSCSVCKWTDRRKVFNKIRTILEEV